MVRFSTIFIHAALAALVALAFPADAAALKVEEQLQLLQTKVNQLEAQVQQHEMLAEKFARLERVLEEMQNERKTSSSWASVSPVHAAIPRTCREAQSSDPTLSSGMYWIDPDGQGIGDSPIYVYCDMAITRLNFGRTQLDTSSGVHTLGRFECTGQVVVNGMPTSCEDLWRIGHTMSGLYSVMGAEMVESVYCDFNKLPSDPGKTNFRFRNVDWICRRQISPGVFLCSEKLKFQSNKPSNSFRYRSSQYWRGHGFGNGKIYGTSIGHIFFLPFGIGEYSSIFICNGFLDRSYSLQSTLNLEAGDQVWVQILNAGVSPIF